MTTLLATVASLLLVACAPSRAQRTTTSPTLDRVETRQPSTSSPLAIDMQLFGGLVVVTARFPRRCTRSIVDQAAAASSTASPAASPVTGEMDCPILAHSVPVTVKLPSGRTIDATTDGDGRFAMMMPANEPAGLVVVVPAIKPTAPIAPPVTPPVTPTIAMPPSATPPMPIRTVSTTDGLRAVGRAAIGCARHLGLEGAAKIHVEIDGRGTITRIETDRLELDECLRTEAASIEFPAGSRRKFDVPFLLARPR